MAEDPIYNPYGGDAGAPGLAAEDPIYNPFAETPAAPVPTSRTFGEKFSDFLRQMGSVAGTVPSGIGASAANVATPDIAPEEEGPLAGLVRILGQETASRLLQAGADIQEATIGQNYSKLSPTRRTERQASAARTAEAYKTGGLLGELKQGVVEVATDPEQWLEQLLNIAIMRGAGKLAGVGGAVGTGVGLQAGDVAGDFYQTAKQLPLTSFENAPEYQRLVAAGLKPEEARDRVTLDLTGQVGSLAALVSGASMAVPGGATLEKILAGKTLGKVGIGTAAKAIAGEAGSEFVEEGGGQLGANILQQRNLTPDLDILQGVGQAAGAGAVMGGLFGSGATLYSAGLHNMGQIVEERRAQAQQDLAAGDNVPDLLDAFNRSVMPMAPSDNIDQVLAENPAADVETLAADVSSRIDDYHAAVAQLLEQEHFTAPMAPEALAAYAEGTAPTQIVRDLLTADQESLERIVSALPEGMLNRIVAALAHDVRALPDDALRAAGGFAAQIELTRRADEARNAAFDKAESTQARRVARETEQGILAPTRDLAAEQAGLVTQAQGFDVQQPTAMETALAQAVPDRQAAIRAERQRMIQMQMAARRGAQTQAQVLADNEAGQFSPERAAAIQAEAAAELGIPAEETEEGQRGTGTIDGRPASEITDAELQALAQTAQGSTRNAVSHELRMRGLTGSVAPGGTPTTQPSPPPVGLAATTEPRAQVVEQELAKHLGPAATAVRAQVVDADSLARERADVRAAQMVAKLFKKNLVFFQAEVTDPEGNTSTSGVGGFVPAGDANSIYLNANAAEALMSVVSHEILHLLKRSSPEVYAALRGKVVADFAAHPEKFAEFRQYYNQPTLATERIVEEAVADALANQASDPKFWANVFARVAAKHGRTEAAGIIRKLRDAFVRLISSALKALNGQAGFKNFITNVEQLNDAFEEAAAQYVVHQAENRPEAAGGETVFAGPAAFSGGRVGPFNTRAAAELSQRFQKTESTLTEEGGQYYLEVGNEPNAAGKQPSKLAAQPERPVAAQPLREGAGRTYRGEIPEYGEPRANAVQVVGTHYSTQPRRVLSGLFYGRGFKGDEAARLEGAPADIRARTYFYVDQGSGIEPEAGVGTLAHEVKLNNVYDLTADPLNLLQTDKNALELSIVKAGFDGYLNRNFGKNLGAVVLLGTKHQAVPVVQVGEGTLPPSGRTVAPPAYTPARQIANEVLKSRELPVGELPARRWGPILETTLPEAFAAMAPTGVFDSDEKLYRSELAGKFLRASQEGRASSERESSALAARVPQRGKVKLGNVTEELFSDYPTLREAPNLLEKIVAKLAKDPGLKVDPSLPAEQQAGEMISRMKDNLLWLYDQVPVEIRQRAKLWYEGAEKIADAWAEHYDISKSQAAGVLAVLSPQKDWYMNVTLAERVLDIVRDQTNHAFDAKMSAAAFRFLAAKKALQIKAEESEDQAVLEAYETIRRKTLGQVLDSGNLLAAAVWVRAYDEAYHASGHAIVTPEGGFTEIRTRDTGEVEDRGWGAFPSIAKALSVLQDGSLENISEQLGGNHKVRNFYNNIFAPGNPNYTTIDTHAVAAATLRSVAVSAASVKDAFGSAGKSASTGIRGSYPIYYEAYKQAAEARGVLPREMQSITWEAVRGLFPDSFKHAANIKKVDDLWRQVDAGQSTREEARAGVAQLTGGVRPPSWVREGGAERSGLLQDKSYVQHADAFRGNSVTFEVAPNPANRVLTKKWNNLPEDAKAEISHRMLWHTVVMALDSFNDDNMKGALVTNRGGYGGETNTSYSLQMYRHASSKRVGELVRLLGYALRQQSMIRTAPKSFLQAEGGPAQKTGAVIVRLAENVTVGEIDALYARLRGLKVNGKRVVSGHTTSANTMVILNFQDDTGLTDQELANAINTHLDEAYDVGLDSLFVEFAEKGATEYGFKGKADETIRSGTGPSLRARADQLRAENDALLSGFIRDAESGRFSGERETAGAGSGVYGADVLDAFEELHRAVGGAPRIGWASRTRIRRKDGLPLQVFRGAGRALTDADFGAEARGVASGNPSSGLGVWFTEDAEEAGQYGATSGHYLDLRNPKVYLAEDLPAFDSVEAARAHASKLAEQGYDGILVNGRPIGGRVHFIAFEPETVLVDRPAEEILATVPEEAPFSPDRSLPFTLALHQGLARAPAKLQAQPASQWRVWLQANAPKLGIKKAELVWTGMLDWLGAQGKTKLTSQDLRDFVDRSGTVVYDTPLNLDLVDSGDVERFFQDRGWVGPLGDQPFEYVVNEAVEQGMKLPAPRYAGYITPGQGQRDYHELLVQLPSMRTAPLRTRLAETADEIEAVMQRRGPFDRARYARLMEERSALANALGQAPADYQSSHWPGYDNVAVHTRVDTRRGEDGDVLFVQELQSDWGQEGKERGFASEAKQRAATLEEKIRQGTATNEDFAELKSIQKRRGDIGVSPAPFVTNTKDWVALGLKRIILHAASMQSPAVVFANGDDNVELFSLSAAVRELDYAKTPTGSFELIATMHNGEHRNITAGGEEELARLVGKDVAQKIVANEDRPPGYPEGAGVIQAADLSLGGEGMRTFYDEIVPQVLKDVLAPIGGKVTTLGFLKPDGSLAPRPGFKVTQDMRAKLQEVGLPMFSAERAGGPRLSELKRAVMQARAAGENTAQAEDSLAQALAAEPTAGYAVQGDLPGGGFLILGHTGKGWQLSRYDRDGLPAGARTYADGREAAGALVSQVEVDTLTDAMASFSTPRFPNPQTARPGWVPRAPTGRFAAMLDGLVYAFQDKHVDLKNVTKALGAIQDNLDAYLQEELYHGRAARQSQEFIVKELRPLTMAMRTAGVTQDELETYLWNRHAEERNIQIAKINPGMQDKGSGIATADARAYLAGLPQARRVQLEALAARVDAMTQQTRAMMVQYGLEKPSTIKAWEKAYAKYVPLQREDVGGYDALPGAGTGQGYNVKGSPIKRAMGSEAQVVDILANIAAQREQTITRGEKNTVAVSLYRAAIRNPAHDFWAPIRPGQNPAEITQRLIDMGLNPVDAANAARIPTERYIDPNTGLVAERANPIWLSSSNILTARVNGANIYLAFNARDKVAGRMVTALKNLSTQDLGIFWQAIGRATRWFAAVNTQYNPVFGVVNLVRDVQGAVLNLETTPLKGHALEIIRETGSALVGIMTELRAEKNGQTANTRWGRLWEEFQEEGGQTGYREAFRDPEHYADDMKAAIKEANRGTLAKTGMGALGLLSDYNEAMENAVRLAAYKKAKDMGLSNQRAASVAKNLTVNFNRKGAVAAQAGALFAFFNASLQGSFRIAKTLNSPAGKKILAGGILLGALQAFVLAAAGLDDDQVPEFIKERNLVIPLGGGRFFTLPYPLGFHIIPNYGRYVMETMLGSRKPGVKTLVDAVGLLLDSFNPIGSAGISAQTFTPTVLDPLVALESNKDWTGRAIAKEDFNSLQRTPGYTRVKDTATSIAKGLSYALNILSGGTDYAPGSFSPTPDQIDYLFGQLGGGVAREIGKTEQTISALFSGEELPPNKIPLVGRFYGNARSSSSVSGQFYANLQKINEQELELKGRREDRLPVAEYVAEHPESRLVSFADDTEKTLKALRKRKDLVKAAGGDRETVRVLEDRIKEVMTRFNDRVEAVEEAKQ